MWYRFQEGFVESWIFLGFNASFPLLSGEGAVDSLRKMLCTVRNKTCFAAAGS